MTTIETATKMRRLAALGKMNAVVMIADEQRLHWMTSSCHYNHVEEGEYSITIWTNTKEDAKLLLDVINSHFEETQNSAIEVLTNNLFTIQLSFEY